MKLLARFLLNMQLYFLQIGTQRNLTAQRVTPSQKFGHQNEMQLNANPENKLKLKLSSKLNEGF